MKRIFIFVLFMSTLLNAGMWEKLQSFGDKELESQSFDIKTKGWNLRSYEFRPYNAPEKLCVVVISEQNGMQMECFTTESKGFKK